MALQAPVNCDIHFCLYRFVNRAARKKCEIFVHSRAELDQVHDFIMPAITIIITFHDSKIKLHYSFIVSGNLKITITNTLEIELITNCNCNDKL